MDNSEQAANIFNKYATEYQNKFMHLDLYNDTFDIFCKNITTENAKILEVACGPGNITQYLLKRRPDFKILGTDLAPKMLELAKINNPTANFNLLDARNIAQLQEKFDGIMCGFCFPYLTKKEAIEFITHSSKILCEAGIIYISTMEENADNKSGFKKGSQGDEIFMNYHQEAYLTRALTDNKFKIIDIVRKDFPTTDGTKTTDLIIIAKLNS